QFNLSRTTLPCNVSAGLSLFMRFLAYSAKSARHIPPFFGVSYRWKSAFHCALGDTVACTSPRARRARDIDGRDLSPKVLWSGWNCHKDEPRAGYALGVHYANSMDRNYPAAGDVGGMDAAQTRYLSNHWDAEHLRIMSHLVF